MAQYIVCLAAILTGAAVLAAFIAPLLQAVLPSFRLAGNSAASPSAATGTLHLQALCRIIIYTFEVALLSTFLALLVGLPAAFLVARRQFPGRKLLASFASVPLCIPPLVIALGYISMFGMAGLMNRTAQSLFHLKEPPFTFLYSFWGIVITQGFYNFPLIMLTVADTWTQLGSDQADSARILGASDWRIFCTVTVPQLFPAVISSCIPVFLYCFFSFMIVMLFGATGITTLEVAIYHAGRSSLNFHTAAVLAVIETVSAFSALLVYAEFERRTSRAKGLSFYRQNAARKRISRKEFIPVSVYLCIILLFFFMPLISIASSSCTLSSWKHLLAMRKFHDAIRNTVISASLTAAVCTIAGFMYAAFIFLKDPDGKHTILRTIPLLPMAVSSVVMGIGMTGLVRRGSVFTLVLAQSALFWPFAFRQIYAMLSKIPTNIMDAARTLSPHRLDCMFSVMIPYSRKSILSAAGFCFALSAGDATLPLVLAIPKFDTLALLTYRLAGSYRVNEACAAGLLLGAICIVMFSLSNRMKKI